MSVDPLYTAITFWPSWEDGRTRDITSPPTRKYTKAPCQCGDGKCVECERRRVRREAQQRWRLKLRVAGKKYRLGEK